MRLIDGDRLEDELRENDWAGNYPPLDEISDIIANQPTVGGWISLKEKLPEVGKPVLLNVYGKLKSGYEFRGAYFFGEYVGPNKPWLIYDIPDWHGATATHWMASPEPPEVSE